MSFNPKELDKKKEAVKLIYGEKDALSAISYCYYSAQETIDFYSEGVGVHSMFQYPESLKKHKEALDRGVRIRVITEVTTDNLPYVKEGLHYVSDVRHMDTITHSFGVSEKHYLSSKLQFGNPQLTQSVFSNIGWFVREQQYLFESLWNRAIPLKQRIREIEEGHMREFVDTIREPEEVLRLIPKVISSAYEKIMLLFPDPNILRGFESAGLTESLRNLTPKHNNVRVRVLLKSPQEHLSSNVNNSWTNAIPASNTLIGQENVAVKFVTSEKVETNTVLVIADDEEMMAIEFDQKNDSFFPALPNLYDSIRFATHTNSESAIMSHSSIFERLWIESELNPHPYY